MAVDKRINYRGGGAYQGGSGAPGSAEAGKTVGSVGGPSYDSGPSISGRDTGGNQPSYERSRNQFIDKFNQDRARDFKPTAFRRTYKPIGLDRFGSSNQLGAKGGLGNLFKALLGFAVPGASFLFNKGKQGITNIGDALGNIREDFTGYRTQEEYDNARQQRINLNRINTIQNTLDRKYSDGDYSNTDLDERLAALRSQMGIVPNTAEQDAQQFLDFGNDLAINTEQSIIPNQVGNIDDLMVFAPNSKRDRALKNLYSGYENLGIKDPQMIDLMQQDLLENKEKGTPLSLPQSAYTLVG